MTPIFSPDFSSVDATIPVYDKGRYRVKVTKRTPTIREAKDEHGNIEFKCGVRYALEMVGKFDETGELISEDYQGRQVSSMTAWVHSEGGWKFSKPFLMAATGYDVRKQEELANKELFQGHKWEVNGEPDSPPENVELGDGWELPLDRLVDVTMTKKITSKDGIDYENQEFGGWAPVS